MSLGNFPATGFAPTEAAAAKSLAERTLRDHLRSLHSFIPSGPGYWLYIMHYLAGFYLPVIFLWSAVHIHRPLTPVFSVIASI